MKSVNLIVVLGIGHDDVEAVLWDGVEITELLNSFVEQGIVEMTEQDDGFQMLVKVPRTQLPGQHELSLIYLNDYKLSATVDTDKLLADLTSATEDRGFAWTEVRGMVRYYYQTMICGCQDLRCFQNIGGLIYKSLFN